MKLVALGAFAPVALAGAVVGGMLAFGTAQDDPAGAAPSAQSSSHEALDCRSPRHSWRWACQQAKSAEGYGVTAVAGDGPETTGSLVSGRSTSAKGADGEPIRAADADPAAKAASAKAAPASEPAKSAKSEAEKVEPAKPVRIVAAEPPAAPEAKPEKRKEAVKEPAKEAALPPAPALAPMVDDEAPEGGGTAPATRVTAAAPPPESKPVAASAPLPVTAPLAAPETAPKTPHLATLPLVPERPAPSLSRGEAAAPDEAVARLSRKRAKAVERAASRRATASRPAARPRVARALPGREPTSEPGGYRVMSLRTYTLPDGRRIVVEQAPRPDVVRELLAEHRAAFARRQFASPYGGLYADEW